MPIFTVVVSEPYLPGKTCVRTGVWRNSHAVVYPTLWYLSKQEDVTPEQRKALRQMVRELKGL